MSALKVVFLAGDRQIVLYAQGMKQMWQVESFVLERLGEEDRLKLETARFRKFWIDEEGDKVEIMNDVDYEFFLKRMGSRVTPKIYFEAQYPSNNATNQQSTASTSTTQRPTEGLSIHATVECDVCKTAPIHGFRYKCMQCPNFDLCMKCEGEMHHGDHIMLRMPNSETTTWAATCPVATFMGSKRRQRKYAAAATAAATATAGNEGDGKSRHHRHHRRHCGNGGAGIWSNFYDMMQDLAEGGTIPVPECPATTQETPQKQTQQEASAPQAEATSTPADGPTTSSRSKETNTSPDRSSNTSGENIPPRNNASAPPSFEHLQNLIDPQFMKAGIQILNNFSEMFGKILDPVVAADISRASSSPPASVVVDIDLTSADSRGTTTPPPTAAGTPKEASVSKETSAAASGIVTPMETEASPSSPAASISEALPRSRNSQSEENDWTMIENNVATSTTETAPNAAASVAAASPPLDFAKLSQQLQSHIESEMKEQSNTFAAPAAAPAPSVPSPPIAVEAPVVAPAAPPSVPATPDTTERRAVAVFHADPRINSSVHAMMAMGFSNESAMLTQLLESVNGSIPLALDLMAAAQRN